MNRTINILIVVALCSGLLPGVLPAQSSHPCAVKFSLAERDELGNVNVGFSPDGQKWFDKKLAKSYPNVCYEVQKSNVGIWFYISVSSRNVDAATAITKTEPNTSGGSTSHTVIAGDSASVYTLKIGRFHNGTLEVLHTFQRAKVLSGAGTVSGLFRSFGNSEHDVITDGVSWISSSNVLPTP